MSIDYKVAEDDLQGLVFDCDGTLIDTVTKFNIIDHSSK